MASQYLAETLLVEQKDKDPGLDEILSQTNREALSLAQKCDDVVAAAFDKHFPEDLQDIFGLSVLAVGSYGRRQQILGVSDADLLIIASKLDPLECNDPDLSERYNQATKNLLEDIIAQSSALGFKNDSFQIRYKVPASLKLELLDYLSAEASSGERSSSKEFAFFIETLTSLTNSRCIAGKYPFNARDEIDQLINDHTLGKSVKEALMKCISKCLGTYRTLSLSEIDLKADLQYAAVFSDLAIQLFNSQDKPLSGDILKIQNELQRSQLFFGKMRQVHRKAIEAKLTKGEIRHNKADYLKADHYKAFNQAAITLLGVEQGLEALKNLYKEAAKVDFLVKKVLVWLGANAPLDNLFSETKELGPHFWQPGILGERLREYFYQSQDTLPELQELSGLVDQYPYQKFSLFEHQLRAVEVLDRLARGKDSDDRFVSLYSSLSDSNKRVLAYATLNHDSGKKEELEDCIRDPYYHASIGAEKVITYALRSGFNLEEQRMIAQLVKNHLWLKDVSKSAIHTIHETLITELPQELRSHDFINLLTLLTYADGIATNPETWTPFRSNHLWEAARSAHNEINNNNPIRHLDSFVDSLCSSHGLRLKGVGRDYLYRMLDALPVSFRALPLESICDFAQMGSPAGQLPKVEFIEHRLAPDTIESQYQTKADVLIISQDRKYLASNLIQALTGSTLNIQSADFYTDKNGIAYDRITVYHSSDRSDQVAMFKKGLSKVLAASDLSIPTTSYSFRELPIVTLLSPRSGADEGVLTIKIKAKDEPGLLLHILTAFNRVGLSLRSCSACLEGEYVEDFFELTYDGKHGARVLTPLEKDALMGAISRELLAK